MFEAMLKSPTKGDWTSTALELVKKFEINLNLNEIQVMKQNSIKKLVIRKMSELAFKDLQKTGGREKRKVYEL